MKKVIEGGPYTVDNVTEEPCTVDNVTEEPCTVDNVTDMTSLKLSTM